MPKSKSAPKPTPNITARNRISKQPSQKNLARKQSTHALQQRQGAVVVPKKHKGIKGFLMSLLCLTRSDNTPASPMTPARSAPTSNWNITLTPSASTENIQATFAPAANKILDDLPFEKVPITIIDEPCLEQKRKGKKAKRSLSTFFSNAFQEQTELPAYSILPTSSSSVTSREPSPRKQASPSFSPFSFLRKSSLPDNHHSNHTSQSSNGTTVSAQSSPTSTPRSTPRSVPDSPRPSNFLFLKVTVFEARGLLNSEIGFKDCSNPYCSVRLESTSINSISTSIGSASALVSNAALKRRKSGFGIPKSGSQTSIKSSVSSDDISMISTPRGSNDSMSVEVQSEKTKVAFKTLNPVWNQHFLFYIDTSNQYKLVFSIYDHDQIFEHPFLGSFSIDLKEAIEQHQKASCEISRMGWKKLEMTNPCPNSNLMVIDSVTSKACPFGEARVMFQLYA